MILKCLKKWKGGFLFSDKNKLKNKKKILVLFSIIIDNNLNGVLNTYIKLVIIIDLLVPKGFFLKMSEVGKRDENFYNFFSKNFFLLFQIFF